MLEKKVLITGASGFIGKKLAQAIRCQGYAVVSLTRDPQHQNDRQFFWDPEHGIMPLSALEGVDGVIHLAGENVAALRWTKAKKERIYSSRVKSAELLAQSIINLQKPPAFFFSASAVGYYGDRGDEALTEASSKGSGFLAEVCDEWEKASDVLKQKGIRVIHGRFGTVLDPSGGVLERLIPFFRLGVGVQFGSGEQWISWISRDDLVDAILWIVFSSALEGSVNCASPQPITQKEWSGKLSHIFHHSKAWKMPRPVVKWLFGEMGEELFLFSHRVEPTKLVKGGFLFKNPSFDGLLQRFFGKSGFSTAP